MNDEHASDQELRREIERLRRRLIERDEQVPDGETLTRRTALTAWVAPVLIALPMAGPRRAPHRDPEAAARPRREEPTPGPRAPVPTAVVPTMVVPTMVVPTMVVPTMIVPTMVVPTTAAPPSRRPAPARPSPAPTRA